MPGFGETASDLTFLELLKAQERLIRNQGRPRLTAADQHVRHLVLRGLVQHRLEAPLQIRYADDLLPSPFAGVLTADERGRIHDAFRA